MPGFGQTIMDAITGGSLAANAKRTQVAQQQAELQQFKQNMDQHMADLVDSGHLNPVMGGLVKRNTSSGPSSFSADAPVPGVPGAGGVPSIDMSYFETPDSSRTFNYKTAEGHNLQFEHATPQQQIKSNADQLLQQFQAGAPLRQAAGQEADVTAARQGAEKRSNAAEDLAANGVPVGDDLADIVGLPHGQKLPPQQYDNLVRAAGSLINFKSEAEARKNKPAPVQKNVFKTEITKDDQGNQSLVTTYNDGTHDEIPLQAKGVSAKPVRDPNQPTQNQAFTRARMAQDKIDRLQSAKDKIAAENVDLGQQMTDLGTQITPTAGMLGIGHSYPNMPKAADRLKAKAKMSQMQAKINANNERFKSIHSEQAAHLAFKDAITGANGIQTAEEPAAAPKTASQAQVQAYAQKYGMTPEAAAAAFKQDGIEVQ